MKLFAQAPWFDTIALSENNVCDRYVTNGYLPGDIQIRALTMFAWRAYFSCADADLTVRHRRALQGKRDQFTATMFLSLPK